MGLKSAGLFDAFAHGGLGVGLGAVFAALDQINKQNVSSLKVAWVAHTGDIPQSNGSGAEDQNTPLQIGDTLYSCTPLNVVTALDADTGKIYEFYVRTGLQWEDINTDAMIGRYAEYLELTGLEKYEDQNPLLETTPYFAKYTFPGEEEDSTTVTIGYYEGIRELFLKVGR